VRRYALYHCVTATSSRRNESRRQRDERQPTQELFACQDESARPRRCCMLADAPVPGWPDAFRLTIAGTASQSKTLSRSHTMYLGAVPGDGASVPGSCTPRGSRGRFAKMPTPMARREKWSTATSTHQPERQRCAGRREARSTRSLHSRHRREVDVPDVIRLFAVTRGESSPLVPRLAGGVGFLLEQAPTVVSSEMQSARASVLGELLLLMQGRVS